MPTSGHQLSCNTYNSSNIKYITYFGDNNPQEIVLTIWLVTLIKLLVSSGESEDECARRGINNKHGKSMDVIRSYREMNIRRMDPFKSKFLIRILK